MNVPTSVLWLVALGLVAIAVNIADRPLMAFRWWRVVRKVGLVTLAVLFAVLSLGLGAVVFFQIALAALLTSLQLLGALGVF
jgi:hypothetical protein